jgi:recombination protein RecR
MYWDFRVFFNINFPIFGAMNFSSKVLEEAVDQLSILPGIGKKSALRLALFLLKKDKETTQRFTRSLINMKESLHECKQCHNISDFDICEICANTGREDEIICIVEDIRDVMAIENTSEFKGKYHVLGGLISPMDGIGPMDLNIESLKFRLEKNNNIKEIIFALSPTMEGDTTQFYLFKQLADFNKKISTLARGVSFGENLEFADELTLGRSIAQRQPYDKSI